MDYYVRDVSYTYAAQKYYDCGHSMAAIARSTGALLEILTIVLHVFFIIVFGPDHSDTHCIFMIFNFTSISVYYPTAREFK